MRRRCATAVLGVLLAGTGCSTAEEGTASPAPAADVEVVADLDVGVPGQNTAAVRALQPLADGSTLLVSHVLYTPVVQLTTVRPEPGALPTTVGLEGGGSVLAVRADAAGLSLLASRTRPDDTQALVLLEVDPATGRVLAERPVSGGPDDLATTYTWAAVTSDGAGFVVVGGQFDGLPAEVLAVDAATGQVTAREPLELGSALDDDEALVQPQGVVLERDGGVVVAVSLDRPGDARNSAHLVRLTPGLRPDGEPVELAADAPSAEFHASVSGSTDLALTEDGTVLAAVVVGEDTDADEAGSRLVAVTADGEARTLLEAERAEFSGLVAAAGSGAVVVRETVTGERDELSAVRVPTGDGESAAAVRLCADGDVYRAVRDASTGSVLVTGWCEGSQRLWVLD